MSPHEKGLTVEIVQNNKFIIPLYHGTSSIFINSILQYGFSAKNPIKTLNILPFYEKLYKICDELFGIDSDWTNGRWLYKNIKDQKQNIGSSNFRHGATYLSPNRNTAAYYAIKNQFGSEILSEAIKLYNKINNYAPERLLKFRELPVVQMLNGKPCPVLFEIFNMDLQIMKSEKGEKIEDIINLLKQDFKVFSQQSNFVLTKYFMIDQFKLYKIVVTEEQQRQLLPSYYLNEIDPAKFKELSDKN